MARVDGTTAGETLLEIRYDALGRRVETVDPQAANPWGEAEPVRTRHVYAGLETAAEYVWQDSLSSYRLAREFVWGERYPETLAMVDYTALGDQLAGGPGDRGGSPPTPPVNEEVLHFVHDALGSVVGLTDAGDPNATPDPIPAKLVERYDYDLYGRTYVEVWDAQGGGGSGAWIRRSKADSKYGNPFMWTCQRYDAGVKLHHFLFRSYSPELGRWMQRDPAGAVDSLNLYEYCRSSPGTFTDPLGLWITGPIIVGPWNLPQGGAGGGEPPKADPCGIDIDMAVAVMDALNAKAPYPMPPCLDALWWETWMAILEGRDFQEAYARFMEMWNAWRAEMKARRLEDARRANDEEAAARTTFGGLAAGFLEDGESLDNAIGHAAATAGAGLVGLTGMYNGVKGENGMGDPIGWGRGRVGVRYWSGDTWIDRDRTCATGIGGSRGSDSRSRNPSRPRRGEVWPNLPP